MIIFALLTQYSFYRLPQRSGAPASCIQTERRGVVSTWNFPGCRRQGHSAARGPQHGSPGEGFSTAVYVENSLQTGPSSDDLTAGCVVGGSES